VTCGWAGPCDPADDLSKQPVGFWLPLESAVDGTNLRLSRRSVQASEQGMGELARASEVVRAVGRQKRRDPIEVSRYAPQGGQLPIILAERLAEEMLNAAMKIEIDQHQVNSVDLLAPAIGEPRRPYVRPPAPGQPQTYHSQPLIMRPIQ
jgi:hypothetical protein